jgi:hypothetical protein
MQQANEHAAGHWCNGAAHGISSFCLRGLLIRWWNLVAASRHFSRPTLIGSYVAVWAWLAGFGFVLLVFCSNCIACHQSLENLHCIPVNNTATPVPQTTVKSWLDKARSVGLGQPTPKNSQSVILILASEWHIQRPSSSPQSSRNFRIQRSGRTSG